MSQPAVSLRSSMRVCLAYLDTISNEDGEDAGEVSRTERVAEGDERGETPSFKPFVPHV